MNTKIVKQKILAELLTNVEWKTIKLGELALFKKGPFGSSLTKSMFVPESETAMKVYEQKNAINKNATLGHYFISPEKFEELKVFEIFSDDIIVSCAGTIGETFIMPKNMKKGIINQALMFIRLHDKVIMPYFLLYFDFIIKDLANEYSKGTAIKNIPPFSVLKQIDFPLPPLPIQKTIVAQIECLFAEIDRIENARQSLLKAVKLARQKTLQEFLIQNSKFKIQNSQCEEWKRVKLGEVCNLERGITFPSNAKQTVKFENSIACVRTANVQEKLKLDDLWYIDKSYFKNNQNKILKINDIIISSANSRELVGKTSYVEKLDQEMTFGGFVMVIRANENLNSKFLFYFLRHIFLEGLFMGESTQTTNIANINSKQINNFDIPLPPFSVQQKIAEKIEAVFSQLDKIEKTISK